MSVPISVVIPAFNSAHLLGACLDSVVQQDYGDLEVIVVDGASGDGTATIAGAFAARYPFVKCISEPDAGVYDAINKGVRLARGEWIYILGCDDRLAGSDVLTAIAPLFTADTDFIHARVRRSTTGLTDGAPQTRLDIVHANICQQAIFYRKSLFARLGLFNRKYKVCSDWDFNIRCFGLPCKPVFSPVVVCHYDGRGMSSQIIDHPFYRDRLSITLQAYGWSAFGPAARQLRYLFHEKGQLCWADRQPVKALAYHALFFVHAFFARFAHVAAR